MRCRDDFREFVDRGAEFLLQVADALVRCQLERKELGRGILREAERKRTYKSVGRTGRSVSVVVGGVAVAGNAYRGVVWERPLLMWCEFGEV